MLKDIIEKAREEYKEQFLPERIVANDPEKQYLADITLEIVEKNHLTFLEAKMREVASETWKAVELEKDDGLHKKTGLPLTSPTNIANVRGWNDAVKAVNKLYKQFIGE